MHFFSFIHLCVCVCVCVFSVRFVCPGQGVCVCVLGYESSCVPLGSSCSSVCFLPLGLGTLQDLTEAITAPQ